VSELGAEYGVHPTMIHQWKLSLLEGAAGIFERGGNAAAPEIAEGTARDLHAKIGALAVANDLLKARALDRQVRRGMIERSYLKLLVGVQFRLHSI
jgi:hypothetical protein